jgi:coproporphyrinogen III oxidase-like Fe-S oxidoreductase
VAGEEILSPDQRSLERIALGLRRKEGIPIDELDGNRDRISPLLQSGFALFRNKKLSLTARGLLLADEIAVDLAAQT